MKTKNRKKEFDGENCLELFYIQVCMLNFTLLGQVDRIVSNFIHDETINILKECIKLAKVKLLKRKDIKCLFIYALRKKEKGNAES
ncbi:MAG: hypothetical protein PWR01_1306 [Clostridiales bacterium]|nr:hypothetical protein [Clostridiales bacterium]